MTTSADLIAWERRMKRERQWTRKRCYTELEVSYTRYMRLRAGRRTLPRHIGLAMTAIVIGLDPYSDDPRPELSVIPYPSG